MIHSMTGFGKAAIEHDGTLISVEVSAVNHRFLDCAVRMPVSWSAFEGPVKQCVREAVNRGRVTVCVNRKQSAGSGRSIIFDETVAKQYAAAAQELSDVVGMGETVSLDTLASLEGIFRFEETEEDAEAIQAETLKALAEALSQFNEARAREGAVLAEDLVARINTLGSLLSDIEAVLPEIQQNYATRLREKLEELTADTAIAEERLALELAMLADKADVTEEIVRLKAHLEHGQELMQCDEPVGRKLDFLCQEIQREINTLGVKTRDSSVARVILEMKCELEKIREQAQNIE